MSILSDTNRLICAESMERNFQEAKRSHLLNDTLKAINEMIESAQKPYNVKNQFHRGDTLDRHSWCPYGNDSELVCLITMFKACRMSDKAEFVRDRIDQSIHKIDIRDGEVTYQVKHALILSGGDLFIPKRDLEGNATFTCWVDGKNRRIFMTTRAEYLNDKVTKGEKANQLYHKRSSYYGYGWFEESKSTKYITMFPFEPDVVAVHYDDRDKTMAIY